MPREIELSDVQKTSILQQEEKAQKDTRVIRWLSELSQQKTASLSEKKKLITELQQGIASLEAELVELKTYTDQIIISNKSNYKKIIEAVISELGIPANTRLQLLFDAGVPKINLLDDLAH